MVQQLVLHNLQIVCQSEDWHTFWGSAVCTMQSADCTNSQIAAWNIYMHTQYWHYSVNPTIEDNLVQSGVLNIISFRGLGWSINGCGKTMHARATYSVQTRWKKAACTNCDK